MNILLVVDDYRGGAGNMAQILALELYRQHTIYFMTLNHHSLPRYELYDINVLEHNITKKKDVFKLAKIIQKTVNNEHIDLVISFIEGNNIIVGLSLYFYNKVPLVVCERSNPLEINLPFPWTFLKRIAYKRANAISVQFECFKTFSNNLYYEKCYCTPNIIKKVEMKKNWLYVENKVKFISNARLANIKRFDIMIKIMSMIFHHKKNIELHIYGDGPERNKLETMISEYGLKNIVFIHSHTNDVYDNLINSDIYLMTSENEGFPNSLSEAMAVGLPSVSFCCHNGLRELIEDGKEGYLIEKWDLDMFVQKCIMLAENINLRKYIGGNALNKIENYNEKRVMKIWGDMLQKVCKEI